MSNHSARICFFACLSIWFLPTPIFGQETGLVAIRDVDPTIKVELRYATARNIVQRPIYPENMPALLRPRVAVQLAAAQAILREKGYGLKIWDAYRPKSAHEELWRLAPNGDYVADPAAGGSLHTWGVAVDATLVDNRGREQPMPTDFDDFTTKALLHYDGKSRRVAQNLYILQNAMARAGFYGVRTEWWHFVAKDWEEYKAIPEITVVRREPTPKPRRNRTAERSSRPPSENIPATPPQAGGR